MPPLKDQPSQLRRGKAPDIVGTLRDWVGQDNRIAPAIVEPEQTDSGSVIGRSYVDEIQQAEVPADQFESLPSALENTRRFDSAPPLQHLFEPDLHRPHGEMAGDADRVRPAPVKARVAEPPHAQRQPSLASRLTRTIAYGMLAIALVGVGLAVISNDQQRGDSARVPDTKIPAAQPRPAEQASPMLQQQFALQQQQLEKLSSDIATLRRLTDGLSARQEETAQNLAKLQASQQNLRDQVTALTALQSAGQLRRHHRRAGGR